MKNSALLQVAPATVDPSPAAVPARLRELVLPPLPVSALVKDPRPRLELDHIKPLAAAPLPFDPVLISAGLAIAARSLKRRIFGWKRYPGSVEAICHGVLEDCWNGRYYAGSAGHFRQFWTRDLALCTPALIRLGFRDRVVASWQWALERFEKAGRITTTIFWNRLPRDVYSFACDSLPMLLFALREAGAEHLLSRHRELIHREVHSYLEHVYDPAVGMARSDGYFSAPRDCMTGRSTVFTNSMLGLLLRLLDELPDLPRPIHGHDLATRIIEQHWSGQYFRDALDRDLPSGDANVWPFFVGLFDDPEMQRRAFATLEARGFTTPVPLSYFEQRLPESELPVPRAFTPNYQGDTSWTQLGPIYLGLLRELDPRSFAAHRTTMSELIQRDGNYLELYTRAAQPYRGRAGIYYCDEGMIWAALFLDLL